MQLVNPLEQQNAVKTLYSEFVSPVCAKYGLTRIELDILLFLANTSWKIAKPPTCACVTPRSR